MYDNNRLVITDALKTQVLAACNRLILAHVYPSGLALTTLIPGRCSVTLQLVRNALEEDGAIDMDAVREQFSISTGLIGRNEHEVREIERRTAMVRAWKIAAGEVPCRPPTEPPPRLRSQLRRRQARW